MEGTLYSSCFTHLNKIPKDKIIFSVVRQPQDIPNIECFAPSSELLERYKSKKIGYEQFIQCYLQEVNMRNDAKETFKNLVNLIKSGKDVVLICYEKTNEYCHRKVLCELIESCGVNYAGEI